MILYLVYYYGCILDNSRNYDYNVDIISELGEFMRILKKIILNLLCVGLVTGIFSSCIQTERLYKLCNAEILVEEYDLNSYRANEKWKGKNVSILGYVKYTSENLLTISFAEINAELEAKISGCKLKKILLSLDKNTLVAVEGKIEKIYSDEVKVKIVLKTYNIEIIG